VPTAGGAAQPFLTGTENQMNGQVSPDGRWVAYPSDESGEPEIYVTRFPRAGGKWQLSHGGGTEPRWRGDMKAIFYIGRKQMRTETAVSAEGSFSVAEVHALFSIHSRPPNSLTDMWTYDVDREGQPFLVNQAVHLDRAAPLNIVLRAEGVGPK
jgi:hypothetical protein